VPTYYVDLTGGSDSNNGLSEGAAYQNLSKVNPGIVVSGDTVLFKKGETWQQSGTTFSFLAGVTYGSYGSGNRPIFEGATLLSGTWTNTSGDIWQLGSVTTTDSSQTMVWEDRVKGTRQTSLGAVTAAGHFFLDDAANILYYWGRGTGGDPNGSRMHVANGNGPFRTLGNNGVLSGLDLRFGAGQATLSNQSGGGVQSGWVIEDCEISGARQHGYVAFQVGTGAQVTIRDCIVHDCGSRVGVATTEYAIFIPNNQGTIIDGVEAYECQRGISVGGGGIDPSNNTVMNCLVYNIDEDGIGITVDGRSGDLVVDCVAHHCGLKVEDRTGLKTFGDNTTFRRCKSYSNNLDFTVGHGFQSDTGATGTLYDHCEAWDNTASGFSLAGPDFKVYHCLAYKNHRHGLSVFGAVGIDNLKVKNCIFADNGDAALADTTANRSTIYDNGSIIGGATGVEFDYNCYFPFQGGTNNNFILYNGTSYTSLAAWQAATAFEDHGFQADPVWTDPGITEAADFTLQTTSPCRDRGVAIAGINDDAVGTPDIGPYELAQTGSSVQGGTWIERPTAAPVATDRIWLDSGWVRPGS
jgi:hypothetical protein